MTLYLIATLLEHEMLIGLANQILHGGHKHIAPTTEELVEAHLLANSALTLAHESKFMQSYSL